MCKMKVIFEDTFQKISFQIHNLPFRSCHFAWAEVSTAEWICFAYMPYCHVVVTSLGIRNKNHRWIISNTSFVLTCTTPRLVKSSSMNLQLSKLVDVTTSSRARCNIILEKFIVECSRAHVGKCCWRRQTHSSLNKNGDHVHHSNGRTHA